MAVTSSTEGQAGRRRIMYFNSTTTMDDEIIHMIDETLPHVGFEVALVLYAWAERRKGVGMSVTPEYLKWLWQDEKEASEACGGSG